MSPVVETPQKAREIIATPEKWTKGVSARDAEGVVIDAGNAKAVCYCAYGSLWATRGHIGDIIGGLALLTAAVPDSFVNEETNKRHVPSFNDHPETTHEDILALFDRAIELAKGSNT